MARLPLEVRGRGTGGFMASVFFGEFLSPLVIIGLGGSGLLPVIGHACWFLLLMIAPAILAPLWAARRTTPLLHT